MIDLQFYPTPSRLASKAWRMFKDKEFSRVLEPSAGDGHLIDMAPNDRYYGRRYTIDAIEIDANRHPTLKGKANIVGFDFLKFSSGAIYSHIIMNPPFAEGAKHVLKAWEILFDGEIVAILNAETVRNPFSKERQLLVRLIEQHGEVEFVQDAFKGVLVEREAEVEVALVYLRKQADAKAIVGDLLGEMRHDSAANNLDAGFREANEVALPNNTIENSVLAFNAAAEAMRQSIFAEARASHYASRLGETMAVRNGDAESDSSEHTAGWVRTELSKRYDGLKDRAWAEILRSTQVTSRLSSKAQQRLESEFENIKKFEFSVANIYAFLQGLASAGGQIQIEMACDVFDLITRYHSDNTVFYMGWKSNDKHRTLGMRIKTTRFIIPGHRSDSWRTSPDWDTTRMLSDFDKVFAMVDGKREPGVSLVAIFEQHFRALRGGQRFSSSYFDIRYYPGVGTIHFYPRDKKLIDRFNRLVGRHRKWLPPEENRVNKDFWLQFDKAEKFDTEIRREVAKACHGESYWNAPSVDRIFHGDEGLREKSRAVLMGAIDITLDRHGIHPETLISGGEQQSVLPEMPLLPMMAA